jgi:glutathione synthase/RimK-type ligase-like ATP-grasp enzyme
VLPALARLGIDAEPAVWDDPSVGWDRYQLIVVRCTWDYIDRRDAFLGWAGRLPRVLNAPPVLTWNTDKTYLRELQALGVPTVATTWLEPGCAIEAAALPEGVVVVKPAVSGGSRDTERYESARADAAQAHMRSLLDVGRTVMVQPYISSVDEHGETGLAYFDGVFSHAIRKAAILTQPGAATGRLFAPEQITRAEPSQLERAAAEAVLDALPWPRDELLYARVDVVRDSHGAPLLLELELTEPSLFLGHGADAAERFASGIARRLGDSASIRMDGDD